MNSERSSQVRKSGKAPPQTPKTSPETVPSRFAEAVARHRAQAKERDRAEGLAHANRLAALILEEGGPAVTVTTSEHYGTRVVFPRPLGHVSVSYGGDVKSLLRGVQTLSLSSMYRSWRQAYERALKRYNGERMETEDP